VSAVGVGECVQTVEEGALHVRRRMSDCAEGEQAAERTAYLFSSWSLATWRWERRRAAVASSRSCTRIGGGTAGRQGMQNSAPRRPQSSDA
jgi:hypothetical protein